MISGKDPDFHRRDLYEAIESGNFPEWELGLQIVEEKDEHKFDFDLLDPTKLIPEELVPVVRVGRLTLNRNTDNFFCETEQVAFHPGACHPHAHKRRGDTQTHRRTGSHRHRHTRHTNIAVTHRHNTDTQSRDTQTRDT